MCATGLLLTVTLAHADGKAPHAHPLADTRWQLNAVQSMDDAQGTTRLKPSDTFEMSFQKDGVASYRLGCHQGVAIYEARPASTSSSGTLVFTQFAGTQATCKPQALDDRLKRDLPFVRSFLIRDGRLHLSLMADGGILDWVAAAPVLAGPMEPERTVKSVAVSTQGPATSVQGRITGRKFVDHVVQASAGQSLRVNLRANNRSTSFVLLPPSSVGGAMASGELSDNHFDAVLPDDGAYTVRVFLIRAAARRGETSAYDLSMRLNGQPLVPVTPNQDALLPGTRFHATTTTACHPSYTQARTCLDRVVRREPRGSATVELTWGPGESRRILFINGEPAHADTSQPMTFNPTDRGWRVTFDRDETFDIPQELVHGG